jgi:hypothetical protein
MIDEIDPGDIGEAMRVEADAEFKRQDAIAIATNHQFDNPADAELQYLRDGTTIDGQFAVASFSKAIDQFTARNIPSTIFEGTAQAVENAAISALPTILRLPPTAGTIDFKPSSGEWVSVHYADDLVPHAPKFKFLFKVQFIGFGNQEFQYYVHRCDKPKVVMNHTDVNYYNFRSKVLTSVTYLPLSMSLLDETGNSVNNFFVEYLKRVSGTGGGSWGIDGGFGNASSSKPYEQNKGYSSGKRIIIEQVFANGLYSNLFELINPRIESFDFDELNMEDSSSGSMLTLTVSYDALECKTVKRNDSYSWGNTDLGKAGGSSGLPNAGQPSRYDGGIPTIQSASGSAIGGAGLSLSKGGALNPLEDVISRISGLPKTLGNIGANALNSAAKGIISSAGNILSRNVSETLNAVKSFSFGGDQFEMMRAEADTEFKRQDAVAASIDIEVDNPIDTSHIENT